ncbi:MAG: oligosaccharide flippase family protein [Candidatus Marinimicrobia bacterium]|jgi:O-antigen/teichoic acid export membrane protein|nr:oligosaccharide flippase family protein [Candidatus Neomarinimicrobiota bacterium]MBT4064287.1 oligosaccharide flippase family protein [Candidatus Neomarinimicrobiota bacterium]MBT4637095.1 oligosaccharide flippase family protein [Candidatus Neomarinimicrobiota bacterium]
MVSKAVPGLIGLASVILFIRIFGSFEYGKYSFLLAQCNLIVAFSFGWLNQAQLRYFSSDSNHHAFASSQTKSFIFSGLIGIFVLSVLIIAQSLSLRIWGISMMAIIAMGGFNYIKTRFQAKLVPAKIIWLTFGQSLFALIIPLGLISFLTKEASTLLLGLGLSFLLIVTLIACTNLKRIYANYKRGISADDGNILIKKWVTFGAPLSIWFAIGLALPFLDRFFINQYQSGDELGIYASLQELLTRIFSLTLFPLVMALHPRIMNLWNGEHPQSALKIIRQSIGFMFLLGVILFIIIWNFDELIFSVIQMAIPEMDNQYAPLIKPLLLTGFLWQLSFITHKMIELKEQTSRMVIFLIPSLIVNLVGNSLFLPQYGLVATAYTALSSALLYCIITGIYSMVKMQKEMTVK